MKLKIFCIRDSALFAYGTPFFHQATGAAVRSFSDEVNNPQSQLFKHPSDFEFYELGEYDDANASFSLYDDPKLLARAKDHVNPTV